MYSKTLVRICEYTPVVKIENNGDGIGMYWREEDEKEFGPKLCLSDEDVKALILMFQEIGKEYK